jgi:hypothetical protein
VWSSLTAQPCCTTVGMGLIYLCYPLRRDDPAVAKQNFSICRRTLVPYAVQLDNSTGGTSCRFENAPPADNDHTATSASSCPGSPAAPEPQLLQGGWTMHGRLVSDGPYGSGLGRSQPSVQQNLAANGTIKISAGEG